MALDLANRTRSRSVRNGVASKISNERTISLGHKDDFNKCHGVEAVEVIGFHMRRGKIGV